MDGSRLWNVEQVARALDMHPKTVRRYIRDGVLKAGKIGRQWRIREEDLQELMSGMAGTRAHEVKEDLRGFVEGRYSEMEGSLQVCTVVDYYVDSPQTARPLAQVLVDLMNSGDPDQKNARFEYHYDTEDSKARFVLWGHPRFLAKLLAAVAEHTGPEGAGPGAGRTGS